ncbi:MAG: chaperone modulator CbpM [Chryseolinea sp.]
MQPDDMILASEFCTHHKIELSFIHSLKEYGMIEIVVVDETTFLPVSELERLEKMLRLHFELDINLEGIDTITHLLQRVTSMQQRIVNLTNRLRRYEEID